MLPSCCSWSGLGGGTLGVGCLDLGGPGIGCGCLQGGAPVAWAWAAAGLALERDISSSCTSNQSSKLSIVPTCSKMLFTKDLIEDSAGIWAWNLSSRYFTTLPCQPENVSAWPQGH